MIYNDIVLFTTVARHLNFSKAAEQLDIPLSRVSRRVAELEEQLGVKLFERTTRQVRLTEEGRHLLDRVQDPVEALQNVAGFAADAPGQIIRLTAPPMAVQDRIGSRLLDFVELNPDIRLDVTATNYFLDFFRDNIDLAFRVGPLKDSNLVARKLWKLKYNFCAGEAFVERHKISGPLTLDRLLDLPSLVSRQSWLLESGTVKSRNVVHEFDTLDLLADAANRNMGITLLPQEMIGDGLCKISLVDAAPANRDMCAVYPSKRLLPARIRKLIEFMAAE
ncbi:LysR family transcriptional regulator [Ruegeria arenilitoris]|uniref:LysR family transcriptional regulator n=1 Tax=Ruegeria arenilitoris TaxID=1173585 RepID=UPI00147A9F73|nr:LysR family transcriptional regulator [Ruegeria arenilitoris]